jgi:hypothetical protein
MINHVKSCDNHAKTLTSVRIREHPQKSSYLKPWPNMINHVKSCDNHAKTLTSVRIREHPQKSTWLYIHVYTSPSHSLGPGVAPPKARACLDGKREMGA